MKYRKPEVMIVGLALHAVQGSKVPTHQVDSLLEMTSGAYEADE